MFFKSREEKIREEYEEKIKNLKKEIKEIKEEGDKEIERLRKENKHKGLNRYHV